MFKLSRAFFFLMLSQQANLPKYEVLFTAYLENPVEGFQPPLVCGALGADHVDVNTFLQEPVGHTEPKVTALHVLPHRHLRTRATSVTPVRSLIK